MMKTELLEQLENKSFRVCKADYEDKTIWLALGLDNVLDSFIVLDVKDKEKPKEDVKPLPHCDADCIHATTIGEGTELMCRKFLYQKIDRVMKCNSYEPFSNNL